MKRRAKAPARKECPYMGMVARLVQPGQVFHTGEDCYRQRRPLPEWMAGQTVGEVQDLEATPCGGGPKKTFDADTSVHVRPNK